METLDRIYEPWGMERFCDYADRLISIRDRMIENNKNKEIQRNFTIGGTFNGHNIVVDRYTTKDNILRQYN